MAALENYKLLIADINYALDNMRLSGAQKRHLRQQRADWWRLVEALDRHMTRWTVQATRANGGPLPF